MLVCQSLFIPQITMKFLITVCCFLLLANATVAAVTHQAVNVSKRKELALTIFNSDFAVVRDRREVVLPTGEIELEFTDVAMSIIPPSVSISSDEVKGLKASQQNYRFDLLNRQTLLSRFVGRKVKYSRSLLEQGNYENVLREGILLSIKPEIVKFGDIIEVDPIGTISLPYLPDDLITTPTLVFLGENRRKGSQVVDVRYHADRIGWDADYSLAIDASGHADLTGWVTISNQSGSSYDVTRLRLVAGQVNRADIRPPQPEIARMSMAQGSMPVESAHGDAHGYDYPTPVRLMQNDMTQLRLITADGLQTRKDYRMTSVVQRYGAEGVASQPVSAWIRFSNSKQNNLGLPIPAGTVRVYQGGDEFVGEARIPHVPEGAEVEFAVGQAFDLTANRSQIVFRRLGERTVEVGYRIILNNAGKQSANVLVQEKISGDWEMVSSSQGGEKTDAGTLGFSVDIPGGASTTLEYQVRINF
jgi:hypothetical protein